MAGRSGVNNLLATEKLEILWGSRGDPRNWALRRGELVDVQKIIADVRKSLDDLKKSLQEVKGDIDAINVQIAAIEGRLDDAEQAINEMEAELDALEIRIDAAESSLTQIETSVTAINTQLAHISVELGSIGGDVTALQNSINTLQNTVSGMQTDIAGIHGDITELQLDVADLEAGAASLPVTADLNTALRNRNFHWSNTSINTPVAGSWGRGTTIAASANDLTQIGIINATGQMFVRYRSGGTWSAWQDIVAARAEPYAVQSNPGTTPFPANAYTAIPFFTNIEISGGITVSSSKTFTVPVAGLYQFELEVRANGGLTGMPVIGAPLGLSIDGVTVPTSLRPGYSAAYQVQTTTIMRLVCTERLAAGAQRVAYLLNQGMASYQVASAMIKITRLSA